MLFFQIVAYVSIYIALAFFALCLATGLYYLAELSEEYTVTSKKILRFMIIGVCVIHVSLFLFDDISLFPLFIGLLSHAVYSLLLRSFPIVKLSSVGFIGSCVMFAISHVFWYRYFTDFFTPHYDFFQLLGFFFTCVWLVPAGLFVTLSISDLSLPGLDATGTGINLGGADGNKQKRRNNVLSMIMSWLKGVTGKSDNFESLTSKNL